MSGAIETNAIGGLYPSPNRMRVEWGLAAQNEDGNYSVINWNVRGVGGVGGYWVQNFQARIWIDGALVQQTGSFQMYQDSYFGSGQRTIGHDGNGNRGFGISADGRIYYNNVNSSGSGSWGLPGLYQAIAFNSISINTITDVSFRVAISVNRTANLVQLSVNGGGWTTYHNGNYGSITVQVGSSTSPIDSQYTHTVRVRTRRASNGWITDSGTYNVTTLTQGRFFDIGDY